MLSEGLLLDIIFHLLEQKLCISSQNLITMSQNKVSITNVTASAASLSLPLSPSLSLPLSFCPPFLLIFSFSYLSLCLTVLKIYSGAFAALVCSLFSVFLLNLCQSRLKFTQDRKRTLNPPTIWNVYLYCLT